MILLIDNYDSFSYNLFQLVGSVDPDIKVIRNDAMTVDEIRKMNPKAIIISPGPGRPEDAGVCIDVIRELGTEFPILGVCLGHQSICTAFGATVSYAKELMHGKQSLANIKEGEALFEGCPNPLRVARYHSLAAVRETMPDCLVITSETADGEVMSVRHRDYPIFGLQYHPESILTPDGIIILKNFLKLAGC